MTTLTEHIIVAGAENRPSMLEKSMYDSWASHIRLFIEGKKHGRMMLDSIDNGPLVYPTVKENGQTRPMKYSKLTEAQQLLDDCDVQETNIILYGVPPDVYALINHQEAAKDIWDRVKPLMKDIKLSYQEPNSPTLYNPSRSLQHLSSLMYQPPQQFTPVYVAPIHHQHHHTPVNPQQNSVSSQPFISPSVTQQSQAEFLQLDFSLVVPIGIATTSKGNYAAGQPRFMKCYNCQGEGHMVRQCTHPKRTRNAAWFKEKFMLAEAKEASQILDEEQLAFLIDPRISKASISQQAIPQNSAFQTEDLDAYDSDCDDLSSAKAVLIANLSSCNPEVLSEVPYSDSYPNDMINQDVPEMQYYEQIHIDDFQDNEIHSDSNIILYS
nr:hypothetical protein [Tanacetum cinerariifolium]